MGCGYVAIHSKLTERAEAAAAGLERIGYRSEINPRPDPRRFARGDVLMIWNRHGPRHGLACAMEQAGGRVLVMENGYVPHPAAADTVALAEGHHTGAGRWWAGGPDRWAALGRTIRPWQARPATAPVIVAPQRGIGPPGVAMPIGWEGRAAEALRRVTRRPVRIRPHPGKFAAPVPLAEDLAAAAVVVVWSSRVGLEALLAGVPVIACAPAWIGRAAAETDLAAVEAPRRGDRLAMFERLAWAQWTLDEVADGTAAAALLRRQR